MTVYIADTNTGYSYLLWLVTTHVVATTNTAISKCYNPTTHSSTALQWVGNTIRALGHCNKIVCFWSPPASILRAILKNYQSSKFKVQSFIEKPTVSTETRYNVMHCSETKKSNWTYSAHAQLCNCAMLVEHVKNWRWWYLMLRFILTIHGCLAGKFWRALCQLMRTTPFLVLPSVVDDVVIIIIITACPHQK